MVKGLRGAGALAIGLVFLGCAAMAETEIVADGLAFPESPLLINGTPHWVEYAGNTLTKLEDGEKVVVHSQDGCGHNGLARAPGDQLALICYESGEVLYIDYNGIVQDRITFDDEGRPFDHPNDIAFTAEGGAYMTTSGPFIAQPNIVGGVFYRAPGAATFTEVANDIHFANGVAVVGDGAMLLVGEHNTNRILKFDIDEDGSLSNRGVFVRMMDLVQDGDQPSIWLGPDGITLDSEGNIFVAHYLGSRVVKMTQEGKLLATYDVPGIGTTNVELDEAGDFLYVTAAEDLTNPPFLGKLWRIPLE